MSKYYWASSPGELLRLLRENGLAPLHVSDEFVKALLEDDDKRETDTTIRDELKEYDRD